jgi:hypothetical protein
MGMNENDGEKDSPIIIRVKFKRSPAVAELRAESYESDDGHLRAKDNNAKTIADFLLDEVAGWWVQPDTDSISLAERIRRAQERVAEHEAEKDSTKSS